ncbi:hypothetical protein, partial [Elizabethkingia miricola]|uniref:hypothetical protein n=1 Tax=Elizabethkingia miricola TaxID=172045 RepID=UPI003892B6DA
YLRYSNIAKVIKYMKTIATKIRKMRVTPYQEIAKDFNTTTLYVGQIARGERIPKRGKGLRILHALEQLTQNN